MHTWAPEGKNPTKFLNFCQIPALHSPSFLQAGLLFHLITLLAKGIQFQNQFIKTRAFIHHAFPSKEGRNTKGKQPNLSQQPWLPAKPSKWEQDIVHDEEMVESGFYLEGWFGPLVNRHLSVFLYRRAYFLCFWVGFAGRTEKHHLCGWTLM